MEEKIGKRISKKSGNAAIEFTLAESGPLSSPVRPVDAAAVSAAAEPSGDADETIRKGAPHSLEFLELAEPRLPNLSDHGNRARLLMQSPNRLFFYWAVARNPFHTLNRALGSASNYSLVLKLVNLRNKTEEIHPVDAAGNWWFSVDPDTEYRAEIGFYAVSRPYIRILHSNSVTTPRKSPSPRTADTAQWRVPAERFARVLDVAGFSRDAFDVALAGDDVNAADLATRSAFAQFSARRHDEFEQVEASEIRYAMLALASGIALEQLRGLISDNIFLLLSSATGATGDRALAALKDKFEFDADEFEIEEETAEPVFGGSLVNFPKRLRTSRKLHELNPFSSHNIRS